MSLLACLCRLLFNVVDAKIVFGRLSWKWQIVPGYQHLLTISDAWFLVHLDSDSNSDSSILQILDSVSDSSPI